MAEGRNEARFIWVAEDGYRYEVFELPQGGIFEVHFRDKPEDKAELAFTYGADDAEGIIRAMRSALNAAEEE